MPFWGLFVQKVQIFNFWLLKWPPFLKVKVDWGLKMAAISKGQGLIEVIFPDKVPFTPRNVPTKFRWNKQNRFGESAKKWFFQFKIGHHFQESCAIRPKFCTALWDHPRYVPARYYQDLCKTEDVTCRSVGSLYFFVFL